MYTAFRPDHPRMGRYTYTYALIADSHLNQEEDESTSPFECNRLANARSRWVVRDVMRWDPDFVIHMGDMVNPIPELPTYKKATENFWQIFGELTCPLHLIPGNHDIGDKPLDWMPAKCTQPEFIEQYRSAFGKDYGSFQHRGDHFVTLNTSLMNSNLPEEDEQRLWLEKCQSEIGADRVFLFTHYPPFIHAHDERSHYDNVDEPSRTWLLKWLEDANIEAVFSAHVHNFFYNRHAQTDLYVLPAVSFVRQDYSELFKVAPPREFGRDDVAKLGYTVVDVYERGHICHPIRSYGQTAGPDEPDRPQPRPCPKVHAATLRRSLAGVEIRKAWLDPIEIPAGGGVDEFERKPVNNDYVLWSLLEMGIKDLRLSASDLWNPRTRARLKDLKTFGFSYWVYCFHEALPEVERVLRDEPGLVDVLELIAPLEAVGELGARCRELKNRPDLSLRFSPLISDFHKTGATEHYLHGIFHGFRPNQDGLKEALATVQETRVFDGVIFSIFQEESPLETILRVGKLLAQSSLKPMCYVRLGSNAHSGAVCDDGAIAGRVAESLAAAWIDGSVQVFLDTFDDADRGYFVRNGLVDRSCNPRLAGKVLQHLTEVSILWPDLFDDARRTTVEGLPAVRMTGLRHTGFLVLPESSGEIRSIPTGDSPTSVTETETVDLATGIREQHIVGIDGRLSRPVTVQDPKLFLFESS